MEKHGVNHAASVKLSDFVRFCSLQTLGDSPKSPAVQYANGGESQFKKCQAVWQVPWIFSGLILNWNPQWCVIRFWSLEIVKGGRCTYRYVDFTTYYIFRQYIPGSTSLTIVKTSLANLTVNNKIPRWTCITKGLSCGLPTFDFPSARLATPETHGYNLQYIRGV